MATLTQKIEERREFGEAICRAIGESIRKLDLAENVGFPVFDQAEFRLVTDPYSRHDDLVGYWFDAERQRVGQIQFHGDGSFYAEYDVLKPHPVKPDYFIDTMTAWGRKGQIKTEAQLLAMAC
ncbi:hypothetical protein [Methylotuvimicrobium sp. KM1]|uniref:hypothetical protein n=1 Tax=Methylotuvimicrobium sp. KM1 TaxID=3377707 RepID=UPI00384C6BDA